MRELNDASIGHHFFDIRSDGLTHQHVSGWVATHGVDAVLNKRSTTWRNLPDILMITNCLYPIIFNDAEPAILVKILIVK